VRIADAEEVAQPATRRAPAVAVVLADLLALAGLPLIGYGLIFNLVAVPHRWHRAVAGIYGWAIEPADDPVAGHHAPRPRPPRHDDDGGDADPEPGAADADLEAADDRPPTRGGRPVG
jgi:hypothetical protein